MQTWSRPSGCANVSGANLRRADLGGAELSHADLFRADLSGANFRHTDLCSADLNRADLSEANLPHADLRRANLSGANLSHADLGGADLSHADLSRANFKEAFLVRTDLDGANLSDADLNGATLVGTDLSRTNLSGTNLGCARVGEAVFGNVDLSGAKGLDSLAHLGASIVDHRTLQRSGPLPVVFLRGCGLPEALIEQLPSIFEQALQFYSCFISYSSEDREFAERLYTDLQNEGVRCFFAPEDMKIGDRIRGRIDDSIRIHDKLLLVLSADAVCSQWVEKEVETAFEQEQRRAATVLFPVRLDETVMGTDEAWAADIRRTRHIGDFTNWKDHDSYQKAFDRLLRDLKKQD